MKKTTKTETKNSISKKNKISKDTSVKNCGGRCKNSTKQTTKNCK